MTLPDEVLKTDVLGRVRITKARRDALPDEFERGGTSAQAFAKLVGCQVPDVRFLGVGAPPILGKPQHNATRPKNERFWDGIFALIEWRAEVG